MFGREPPLARHVALPPARLRDHALGEQQSELDPDSGETDPFAARLGAGRDVVIAAQIGPLHARTVVDDEQRRARGIGAELNAAGPRIEAIGHV